MTINTLYELARNSVEKFASKVAFSMFEGDDVTYAEVGRRIAKVQEILTGAGLQAGFTARWRRGKRSWAAHVRLWTVRFFTGANAARHGALPLIPLSGGGRAGFVRNQNVFSIRKVASRHKMA